VCVDGCWCVFGVNVLVCVFVVHMCNLYVLCVCLSVRVRGVDYFCDCGCVGGCVSAWCVCCCLRVWYMLCDVFVCLRLCNLFVFCVCVCVCVLVFLSDVLCVCEFLAFVNCV